MSYSLTGIRFLGALGSIGIHLWAQAHITIVLRAVLVYLFCTVLGGRFFTILGSVPVKGT
jgi:hypothetical protein